jgi:type II secretory pathway pseudopilin PulG
MRKLSGFSLPEVMVVVAILIMSTSLVMGNLFSLRQSTSITTTVDSLIVDMKEQQIKAMVGDTEGGVTAGSYGVYFEATRYILFHGNTYSAADPKNSIVNLDGSIYFSSMTFPGTQIVFFPQSGEVAGFVDGSNTITVKDLKSTKQKVITLNRYGVVTSIN